MTEELQVPMDIGNFPRSELGRGPIARARQSVTVGYKPAENAVTIYDFHATVLSLLGLNHEKLTFYNNGIKRRLTDVHGQVIRDVIRS